MIFRPVTVDDYLLLSTIGVHEIEKIINDPGSKQWIQHIDTQQALHYIMHSGDAYIVDETYLVLVHAGEPWYGNVRILNELLVLALNPGGSFLNVPLALEAIARQRECKLVATGTALASSDRALTRMYNRQGYKQEAVTLIKTL